MLVLPLVLLLLGAAPAGLPPRRIVSLNLCADQYLLALADPAQIAALTVYARDPEMSAEAARAAHFPITRGSAEDVLLLRPDLIIAAPGRRRETMAQLRGRKIATLDLAPAESYQEIVTQIGQVADAVGHPERGRALIGRMNEDLARLPPDVGRGRVAAYYQRRGYLTGTGTLIDDLMHRVGLVNLASKLGKGSLARLSLEQMALERPDLLILETATEKVTDRGTEMLHHPVLGDVPRITLPQAWTVCGGPAFVQAARSLTVQLQRSR